MPSLPSACAALLRRKEPVLSERGLAASISISAFRGLARQRRAIFSFLGEIIVVATSIAAESPRKAYVHEIFLLAATLLIMRQHNRASKYFSSFSVYYKLRAGREATAIINAIE